MLPVAEGRFEGWEQARGSHRRLRGRGQARPQAGGHAVVALREPLSDFQLNALNASHCQACDYAVADPAHGCTLCGARLCESCLLFDHDAVCAKRGGARAASMGLDPDLPTKCAVCGRRPEIRCAQCGEVYCLWMGQPRCFRQRHVKGKRADHEYVPYTLLEGLDRRVAAEDAAEAERVAARRASWSRCVWRTSTSRLSRRRVKRLIICPECRQ